MASSQTLWPSWNLIHPFHCAALCHLRERTPDKFQNTLILPMGYILCEPVHSGLWVQLLIRDSRLLCVKMFTCCFCLSLLLVAMYGLPVNITSSAPAIKPQFPVWAPNGPEKQPAWPRGRQPWHRARPTAPPVSPHCQSPSQLFLGN